MNKLIIPIIVILILAAGIGAYFVFQKPLSPPAPPPAPPTPTAPAYQDSPFAFNDARFIKPDPGLHIFSDYPKYINDLNIKWTRAVGFNGFKWSMAQSDYSAPFNWEKFDANVKDVQKNNLLILITLVGDADWDQKSCYSKEYLEEHKGKKFSHILPCDLAALTRFIKETVERYDGDGKDDMSNLKYGMKYWMIGDEPDHKEFWQDTPENFAIYFATAYRAIKEADPDAKVHMGGTAGCVESYLYANESIPEGFERDVPYHNCREDKRDGFFVRVFKKLDEFGGSKKFNIHSVDFHWFADAGDYKKIKIFSQYIHRMTSDFGYGKLPIWSTEMGTFSGQGGLSGTGQEGEAIYQTEKEQSQELVKRYVYGLAWSVKKSFWEGLIGKQEVAGADFFSRMSLMDEEQNKKLAYYTYKKMVEILEGSDWNNIQTIQEKDGVYIYKFIKNSKPIWVAWNDNSAEKQITISGITSSQVKITKAVPKYESGKDVADYNTAFNTETKSVSGGKITITLGDVPIFMEGK